ncbi:MULTISPECIES: 50S ribosomal protein L29 [Treponema]|jgi:large subunit ribosomal protein L29|uniref:Large ribosomal subunit protein uL29 n=1 Tax=Treponema saccharophilum DSM 2985 TaxID=907348 RepID=H7END6_9SPIR|nr:MULTISPECIES: 50S ribosomal protein L29 [Treponema]EIC00864.1 LSU ribosomal protein L29P [Treponema saccharophilum DSM 2985]MBQ5538269.1 50S ribosomal protein L29 [Treponema sp.]BDC95216.1 50S ribosomal protein L29 [Treponema saccharophilum]
MADTKKKNVKDLSYAELIAERNKVKQEYMDLRFQSVIGHVDNPMQKRLLRRQIAKLNTFIREKEISGLDK